MTHENRFFSPRSQPNPFIDFFNCTIKRGEQVIIDKLSLKIADGENIAILGPNGSGKSTLMKAFTRDIYPAHTSGTSHTIWGREQWNVFELRSHFGIVSTDIQNSFSRDISGRDVLLSGFFSSIGLFNHIVTPLMEQRVTEISSFLETDHLLNRTMTTISTGEARRLLIGRALVHNPEYIILDEPTSNLDLSALHILRDHLRRIARAGVGIIMVTHQIHDIIPEIDRIIMLKNGTIVGDGRKKDLLTGEHVGNLFSVSLSIREEGGYYYATGY